MPKWLRWVIVVGVILDLVISIVLITQQMQIEQHARKSNCWASVLDKAVSKHPSKVILLHDAQNCKSLP